MKVTVVGTGYVGLVAGACFADTGHHVTCIDIDEAKIRRLTQGEIPIFEPGLSDLVHRNSKEGRLKFDTNLKAAVETTDIIFIAVGTPSSVDGSADLKYVLKVASDVAASMNGYKVIVNKSTVPVGTAAKVAETVSKNTKHPFDVVSNPEFLKEGAAIDDFLRPDRVVIGTTSPKARAMMEELYAPFVRQGNPVIFMDNKSAEMTKYAANCFLAVKISFINEVANLCEAVGADVEDVRRGITSDRRIGKYFLYPGVGYGGSCFPKDVKALLRTGEEYGSPLKLTAQAEAVNEAQKTRLFHKAKSFFGGNLSGKKFAIWGLAFKPNTDDMREAPSISLIEALLEAGASITAFDPIATHEAKRHLGERIQYAAHPYDALREADALFIVTEWNEFKNPEWEKFKGLKAVFDGRNIYPPEKLKAIGVKHFPIGRVGG